MRKAASGFNISTGTSQSPNTPQTELITSPPLRNCFFSRMSYLPHHPLYKSRIYQHPRNSSLPHPLGPAITRSCRACLPSACDGFLPLQQRPSRLSTRPLPPRFAGSTLPPVLFNPLTLLSSNSFFIPKAFHTTHLITLHTTLPSLRLRPHWLPFGSLK